MNTGKNTDSIVMIFKCLSQTLGEIGTHAKNVVIKCQNQILDPLRLFTDNCVHLSKQFVSKLKQKEA
jgi:hypothetical protein